MKYHSASNQRPSRQMGNYCFLIAGVEMLTSCLDFVKFINEYSAEGDTIDLTPINELIKKYMLKEDEYKLYPEIESIVFKSFDIDSYGQMEDMNVIFLYFQKSEHYLKIFAPFVYLLDLRCIPPAVKQPFRIFLIRQFSPAPLDRACNVPGVFSFALRCGNHYAVYQRYKKKNETFFVAKNTSTILNCRWDVLAVFCIDIKPVLDNLIKFLGAN